MTEALASVEGIRHSPRCDRERIENRRGGNIAHFRSCRARGITSVIHARTTRSNGMTRIEAVRRHLARMITVTRCPVARYIPRISRAPVYRSSFSALLFRLSSVACMQRAFQKSKRIATVKYLSLVRFRLKRREDLVVGKRAPTLSLLLFFFSNQITACESSQNSARFVRSDVTLLVARIRLRIRSKTCVSR